jgi:hypothetical protein
MFHYVNRRVTYIKKILQCSFCNTYSCLLDNFSMKISPYRKNRTINYFYFFLYVSLIWTHSAL